MSPPPRGVEGEDSERRQARGHIAAAPDMREGRMNTGDERP